MPTIKAFDSNTVSKALHESGAWDALTKEQREQLAKELGQRRQQEDDKQLQEIRKQELRRWRINRGKAVHLDCEVVVERLTGPHGELGGWWQVRIESRKIVVPVRTREEGMQLVDALRATV